MAKKSDASELAHKLKAHIDKGKQAPVKEFLDTITDKQTIKEIEDNFPDTDPVNHAINEQKEKIAILLVEKGFGTNHIVNHCNQWCFFNDHPETTDCPFESNTLQNAKNKMFDDLVKAIEKA